MKPKSKSKFREDELRRQYNENQEDDTQPEMTFAQWKKKVSPRKAKRVKK